MLNRRGNTRSQRTYASRINSSTQHTVKMLSERQKAVMVEKINDDINLPLVSEEREERLIAKLVDKLVPKVEPSLLAIIPEVYVMCIKLALDENIPIKERRKSISDKLRAELSEPLSRQLNERVDCSMIPERVEGQVLKIVANKVIDQFVDWTVGEVNEHFT